jgi:O-antigen/teichoic acid export membrane protein
MPFFSVNYIIAFSLRGLKHTKRFILLKRLAEPCLKLLFVIIGIFFIGGLQGAASGFSFAIVVVTVIGFGFLYRSNWRPSFGWHNSIKSLVIFSLPLTLSYSTYILLSHLDKLLLGFFTTSTIVGEYEAALTLALLLEAFHSAFSFYLFPKISELQSEDNSEQISSVFNNTTKWIFTTTTPAFLIIMAKPELILFVFNPEYIAPNVITTLQLLATGVFLHAILGPNGEALLGFGRSKIVVLSNTVAVVANLGLNLLLIPRYGAAGAAISLIFGYICMNGIKSGELWRSHQIIPIEIGTFWRVGLYSALLIPVLSQISLTGSRVANLAIFSVVYIGLLASLLTFYYLTNNLSKADKSLIKESFSLFR